MFWIPPQNEEHVRLLDTKETLYPCQSEAEHSVCVVSLKLNKAFLGFRTYILNVIKDVLLSTPMSWTRSLSVDLVPRLAGAIC